MTRRHRAAGRRCWNGASVRFLHTSDWHLGRQVRGLSRHPEFEAVLDRVVDIATHERVDAVLIAGDTFDTFAPPADAEQLLYETLRRLVAGGIAVVTIAGNHDNARHMDALTGLFKIAGIHALGSLPTSSAGTTVELQSRNGKETAVIAALPWVPERLALAIERLAEGAETAVKDYSAGVESLLRNAVKAFRPDTINVLTGHMLIDGTQVAEGSGERKLHIGQAFAVQPNALPTTAQYVALGHVHKPQQVAGAAMACYSGSLLQLDFGESGQTKTMMLVDIAPGSPPSIRPVAVAAGRNLTTVNLTLDELPAHAGRYDDDYLRVWVEAPGHVPSLAERVREFLPNAVDIQLVIEGAPEIPPIAERRTLSPEELFARYYLQKRGTEASEEIRSAFRNLYQQETEIATP